MSKTKRVLFVDDDAHLLEVLARQARALGLKSLTAQNALTALNLIEREDPDLICLDVDMPTANGLTLGEMVSVTGRRVPLVILTGLKDEVTRQRCAELGAHYLAKGSDTWARLRDLLLELLGLDHDAAHHAHNRSQAITELVFEMLGASESFLDSTTFPHEPGDKAEDAATGPWVLCVEDDRDFSLALQMRLNRHGISVVRVFEGVEGIDAASTRPAEAILLDYNLPNGRGDFVLRRLKANPVTRDIPVIVISGQKRAGLEKEMLHLGAARFFAKPVRFEELIEELQRYVRVAV